MVIYDNIPQELKTLPQWICWKLTDGKKVPKIPGTDYGASTTKPKHWRTFNVALAEVQTGKYDGIGFVFKDGSGYVGIDIDNCVSNGELSTIAKEVIAMIDSYTEYSTSGSGIHIICKADELRGGKKGSRDDNKGLEIYRSGRYFVMTGNALLPTKPINERQNAVYQFMDTFLPEKKERSQTAQQDVITPHTTVNVSDNELIERIKSSAQGAKFSMLFDRGDISSYANDDSRADAALIEIIAWWTTDPAQIERIFSASALARRDKWVNSKYYRDRTINETIKRVSARGGGYNPTEYAKRKQEERLKELEKGIKESKNKKLLKEVFFYELSDTGNAERIKALSDGNWLYCSKDKSWWKWNGKRWEETDGSELTQITVNVFRLMKGLVKEIDFEN